MAESFWRHLAGDSEHLHTGYFILQFNFESGPKHHLILDLYLFEEEEKSNFGLIPQTHVLVENGLVQSRRLNLQLLLTGSN